jgi:hypothetical protein
MDDCEMIDYLGFIFCSLFFGLELYYVKYLNVVT